MSAVVVGVVGAIIYFATFGVGFLVRPSLVSNFGLRWSDAAGRTEVRCYYGAVSCALAGFLAYLLANDAALHALTGVLLLAAAVLCVRIVGTAIEGAWSAPYTRLAIPTEGAFVAALAVIRITA